MGQPGRFVKAIARALRGRLLTQQEAFWRHLIVSVFGHSYEQDVLTIIERLAQRGLLAKYVSR